MSNKSIWIALATSGLATPVAAETGLEEAMLRADAAAALEDVSEDFSRESDGGGLEAYFNRVGRNDEMPALARPLAAAMLALQDEEQGGGAAREEGPISISFDLAAVTDYRFRGISLSDKDPAFQPSVTIAHSSGLYLSAWGSNIARFAGTNVELDLTAGWSGSVGAAELEAGVIGYLYPGGSGGNYVETFGSIGTTLGPVEAKIGAAYAPSQKNIGSDNVYIYGALSSGIPGTPFTLNAQVGHEDGSLAGPTGKKWDWSLGAQYVLGKATLGISYVDTDIKRSLDPGKVAKAGVVGSITFSF